MSTYSSIYSLNSSHNATTRLTSPTSPTSRLHQRTQLGKAEDDEAAAASKIKDVEKKMAGANMIMKKRFAKQLEDEKKAFAKLQAATEGLRAEQLKRQAEVLGVGGS